MRQHAMLRRSIAVAAIAAALTTAAAPAIAVPSFDYVTPLFGLAARGETLFVADSGQGIVRLGETTGRLAVELPGVTDVAPLARGKMWAITSAPKNKKLWFISKGDARVVANLGKFEKTVNPDQGINDSNPYHLEAIGGGQVLVADAAANALLIADRQGNVDWVATLPSEEVSTQNAKDLVGCPNAPPDFEEICALPPTIPAEPVTTSIAVGPDGAYYLGELKGFPAPTGASRIWRVEAGTLHADCSTSTDCSVVADGFTSIVDLTFDDAGTLFVDEFDEASWFAVELEQPAGGTIDACDSTTWVCTERATGLTMPLAIAVTASNGLFAVTNALIPGAADVVEIP